MIPTQTLESYPVFGDNSTKVKPDDAKYANGFIEGDVYPAEWVNWAWNKNTKGITDANAGISSMEAEINSVLTEAGKTPDETKTNQLLQSIQKLISDAKDQAILAAHPIGSLYWSSQSTDPSELFGGTWTPIKDRFVWAKGDSDTVNNTGGAKTVTLQTSEIPAHTHTFTGSAVTSGDSSAANTGSEASHTHSVSASGTTSGGAYSFTGTAVTSGDGGAFAFSARGYSGSGTEDTVIWGNTNTYALYGASTPMTATANRITYNSSSAKQMKFGAYAHSHSVTAAGTISVTTNPSWSFSTTSGSGSSHKHSMAHTHSVTASGTNSNTGGGGAHNNMPPYIIKYCWERTA